MPVIFGFNYESLDRHGVTAQECLEALADPLKVEVEEGESANQNPRSILGRQKPSRAPPGNRCRVPGLYGLDLPR